MMMKYQTEMLRRKRWPLQEAALGDKWTEYLRLTTGSHGRPNSGVFDFLSGPSLRSTKHKRPTV